MTCFVFLGHCFTNAYCVGTGKRVDQLYFIALVYKRGYTLYTFFCVDSGTIYFRFKFLEFYLFNILYIFWATSREGDFKVEKRTSLTAFFVCFYFMRMFSNS